jgi:hypothetical protein
VEKAAAVMGNLHEIRAMMSYVGSQFNGILPTTEKVTANSLKTSDETDYLQLEGESPQAAHNRHCDNAGQRFEHILVASLHSIESVGLLVNTRYRIQVWIRHFVGCASFHHKTPHNRTRHNRQNGGRKQHPRVLVRNLDCEHFALPISIPLEQFGDKQP